ASDTCLRNWICRAGAALVPDVASSHRGASHPAQQPGGGMMERPETGSLGAAPAARSRRGRAGRGSRRFVGLFDVLAQEAACGTPFLLAPAMFGAGVLLAYGQAWRGPLPGALLVLLLVCAWQGRGAGRTLAIAILLVTAGWLRTEMHVTRLATPMLGSPATARLTGRIVRIEPTRSGKWRLTLEVAETDRPRLRHAPARVRIVAASLP